MEDKNKRTKSPEKRSFLKTVKFKLTTHENLVKENLAKQIRAYGMAGNEDYLKIRKLTYLTIRYENGIELINEKCLLSTAESENLALEIARNIHLPINQSQIINDFRNRSMDRLI